MTARLTAPLGDAARVCEIAGIVIGLVTGMHPLVMACAKRLAHDELGNMLARGFEQLINSIDPEPQAHPQPDAYEEPEADLVRVAHSEVRDAESESGPTEMNRN